MSRSGTNALKGRPSNNPAGNFPPGYSPRTSHYGYDCVLAGPFTEGWVNCTLRKNRIPIHIQEPLRSHLPYTFRSPIRSHDIAHTLIDAIYSLDLQHLIELMHMNPGFQFGFEEFLHWAERRLVIIGKKASREIIRLPTCDKIIDRKKIRSHKWEGLIVDFNILRFKDGDAWGELLIRDGNITLTRAMVGLESNIPIITHHYPGRYKARHFFLPLLKQYFGNKAPGKHLIRPEGTERRGLSVDPVR